MVDFVEVDCVGCMQGYLENAPTMISQFEPIKLIA